MPKFKIFLWQLCHLSLRTRGNFLLSGMDIDPLCPHCNGTIETTEHLFLECQHAQLLWQLARNHQWVTVDLPSSSQMQIENWLFNLKHSLSSIRMERIVALLWKLEIVKFFRNESSSLGISLLRAKCVNAEWRIRHKLSQPFIHPNHIT